MEKVTFNIGGLNFDMVWHFRLRPYFRYRRDDVSDNFYLTIEVFPVSMRITNNKFAVKHNV